MEKCKDLRGIEVEIKVGVGWLVWLNRENHKAKQNVKRLLAKLVIGNFLLTNRARVMHFPILPRSFCNFRAEQCFAEVFLNFKLQKPESSSYPGTILEAKTWYPAIFSKPLCSGSVWRAGDGAKQSVAFPHQAIHPNRVQIPKESGGFDYVSNLKLPRVLMPSKEKGVENLPTDNTG